MNDKKYWYITEISMCPICGEERKIRYREYSEKPKNIEDRIKFTYINHYCDSNE